MEIQHAMFNYCDGLFLFVGPSLSMWPALRAAILSSIKAISTSSRNLLSPISSRYSSSVSLFKGLQSDLSQSRPCLPDALLGSIQLKTAWPVPPRTEKTIAAATGCLVDPTAVVRNESARGRVKETCSRAFQPCQRCLRLMRSL